MNRHAVRAGGGVVWRRNSGGVLEILVVHRPKYDDWTLPKGKAEPGESDEECALREVEEETGLRCELGEELGRTDYIDHKGRAKTVRYWTMRPLDGRLKSHGEVDDARWISAHDASDVLTYERDAGIVRRLLASE